MIQNQLTQLTQNSSTALNGRISSNQHRRTRGFGSILQLRFKLNGIGWSTSAICHGLKCFVHLGLAVPGQNGQTCRNIGLLERTESNIFLSHLLVNKPSLLTFRIFFLKGWSMGSRLFERPNMLRGTSLFQVIPSYHVSWPLT